MKGLIFMISILLTVLISINLIFLSYGRIRLYYVFGKSYIKNIGKIEKTSSNLVIEEENIVNSIDESRKDILSVTKRCLPFLHKWLLNVIVAVIILIIIVILIGITTSKIWGTILLAAYFNFVYATIFLIVTNLGYFLIGYGIHKSLNIDSSVTKRALIMDTMQFSMLSILLYFAAFGYPLNVVDLVQDPFQWNIVFNNLASILLPMLFFSIIIIDLLSVVIRIHNIFKRDREKQKLIRIHQLLFIFIGSCFIGILYITDIDLSFMSDFERSMYLQTLEVVKWIVTSVFIPLFLYTISNFEKDKPVKY